MMQITLDLVPTKIQGNEGDKTLTMVDCEFYAKKLQVRGGGGFHLRTMQERCQGFNYYDEDDNRKFIYLTADEVENTIEFYHKDGVTLDHIVFFFENYLDAIDTIGFECLKNDD